MESLDLIEQRARAAFAPCGSFGNTLPPSRGIALSDPQFLGETRIVAQVTSISGDGKIQHTGLLTVPAAVSVDAVPANAAERQK